MTKKEINWTSNIYKKKGDKIGIKWNLYIQKYVFFSWVGKGFSRVCVFEKNVFGETRKYHKTGFVIYMQIEKYIWNDACVLMPKFNFPCLLFLSSTQKNKKQKQKKTIIYFWNILKMLYYKQINYLKKVLK